MNELIRELAASLGLAADQVLAHYVRWFIVDSIVGLLIAAFLIFFMVVFIWTNLADLLAPEGRAIHQILSDIRG